MNEQLIALLDGHPVGVVEQAASKFCFTYDQAWQDDPQAYPLSLSLPVSGQVHGHAKVSAYLWGLLPDNEQVLQAWGRRFHVSPRNPFRLLSQVGEDCAGAVQFVSAQRAEALRKAPKKGTVEWLNEAQVAERLRRLRQDPAAVRQAGDQGKFSLAGAQPKTALLLQKGRWGVPAGRAATTHILKPPIAAFAGHAENEHFCLQLARALGLTVPDSTVEHFEDQVAIVVKRFDRTESGGVITRIHQEDFCQALGIQPTQKYESDGGPTVADIVRVLRQHSTEQGEDVAAFLDALAFNWLIAGTDAHAKNYGLLLGPGIVRLAPFYDMGSILPYDSIDQRKAKLAMKLGGEYRLSDIGLRHWKRLAASIQVPASTLLDRVSKLIADLPKRIEETRADCSRDGLDPAMPKKLSQALMARAKVCKRTLAI